VFAQQPSREPEPFVVVHGDAQFAAAGRGNFEAG
jgi:hypothetical protein